MIKNSEIVAPRHKARKVEKNFVGDAVMGDYSTDYVAKWNAGQSPEWDYPVSSEETLRAVLHDQTYMLYSIFKDDLSGFAEWVALQWQEDNDPMHDDDSAEDYLERIDVRIISRPSIGRGAS